MTERRINETSQEELYPVYYARLTSGGGQGFHTLDEALEKHHQNLERLGPPGTPVSLDEALERGEAWEPGEDIPPPALADGVYLKWETAETKVV